MQFEVGQDKHISITVGINGNGSNNIVFVKRNWIQSIMHCQVNDKGGYGARFHVIPQYFSRTADTRMMWILSGMLVCVKQLWSITDKCEMSISKWHGWMLSYLTKKCFPSVSLRTDHKNPMKTKHISSIPKLMEKLHIDVGSVFEYTNFSNMFDDHAHVSVHHNSVF